MQISLLDELKDTNQDFEHLNSRIPPLRQSQEAG